MISTNERSLAPSQSGELCSDSWIAITTAIYVSLVIYIVPVNLRSYITVVWLFILLAYSIVSGRYYLNHKFRHFFVLAGVFCVGVYCVAVCISSYPIQDITLNLAFLAGCFVLFGDNSVSFGPKCTKSFFIISTIGIVLAIITNTDSMYPALLSYPDRNYTAVASLLYFFVAVSRFSIVGLALSVSYAALTTSRAFMCSALIFLVIRFIPRFRSGLANRFSNITAKSFAAIITIMLIGIICVSQFWVSSVMTSSPANDYHSSLNDTSNAIRFSSDVYALNTILRDPLIVVRGYDSEIREQLGATTGTNKDTMYNGFRVVQPHHSVLNMILRDGVLFTLFYFALLAVLFSRVLNGDNMDRWVPYFGIAMVMHSLFNTYFLLLFLFVVAISNSNQKPDRWLKFSSKRTERAD